MFVSFYGGLELHAKSYLIFFKMSFAELVRSFSGFLRFRNFMDLENFNARTRKNEQSKKRTPYI